MSADPFNFGPPPGNPPGSQPSTPGPGPFGGDPFSGGDPFGGRPQRAPGGHAQPGSSPQRAPADPLASPPLGAPPLTRGAAAFGGAAGVGLRAAKPPVWLLFVAAGVALVAGVVALLLNDPVIAIICWFLAGPVAIGLLALFVVRDTFARSSGLYASPSWVRPVHYGAVALCLVCILAPALRIADWVGHL